MGILRHLVIIVAYGIFAAAVALALPSIWPDINRGFALLAGALTFLLGALVHEVVARQEAEQRMARRFVWLRQAQEDVLSELGALRERLATVPGETGQVSAISDTVLDLQLQQRVEQSIAATERARPEPVFTPPAFDESDAEEDGRREPSLAPLVPPIPTLAEDAEVLVALREALKFDRFDLYQQPIVGLPQRKLRFFEVFSRVRDAGGHSFKPYQYIALAERENLIAAVDNLLLFRCIQAIRDNERRAQGAAFFCNVSANTLADTTFMTEFAQYMGRNLALTPKLVFELKQQDLLGTNGISAGLLERMRRMRFHFSMDRITSFDLPFDELAKNDVRFLKIEAELMLQMARQPSGLSIINDFQYESGKAGLDLIVEKIESEQQLLELLDLKIDFGQGYLFGEPKIYKPVAA